MDSANAVADKYSSLFRLFVLQRPLRYEKKLRFDVRKQKHLSQNARKTKLTENYASFLATYTYYGE